MPTRSEYQIKLDVIGNDVVQIRQAATSMRDLKQETSGFQQMLQTGFGIDIARRISEPIAQIPGYLKSAIDRGYEFNKQMYDAEIGISNVLAKFMQLDRAAAKQEAAKAMAKLIELEPKTAGTLGDLVSGFLATVAASQAAGISVEKNIELVGKFANAVANANLPSNQLAQEMRAILTGNITADAMLAKTLDITTPDVNAAKLSGSLYDMLTEKIGELGEAGDSASVRLSTLQSAIDKTLGRITEPVFEAVFGNTTDLTKALENPEVTASLNELGELIGMVVESGYDMAQMALENRDVLVLLAHAAGLTGSAFAGLQLVKLLSWLGRTATAFLAAKLAADVETAAVQRNTAALAMNALARGRVTQAARFASMGSNIGGALGIGGAVLAGSFYLLQQMEASVEARLKAEEKINQAIADRRKAHNDEITNARTAESLAKTRAEIEKEIAEVDAQVAALRGQLTATPDLGTGGRFQVGQTLATNANAGIEKQIGALLTDRRFLSGKISAIDTRGADIVAGNQELDAKSALLEEQEKLYGKAVSRVEELEQSVAALRLQQRLASAEDLGKIGILEEQKTTIESTLAAQLAAAEKLPDAEKRALVIKDAQLAAEQQRLPLNAAIAALKQKIADDEKKATDEGAKKLIEEQARLRSLQDGRSALNLSKISAQRDSIEQNPFLTGAQKRAQIAPLLDQQNAALKENISLNRDRLESGELSAEGLIETERRLVELQGEQNSVIAEQLTGGFGGEFQAELTTWLDGFGSNASQVADILTGTVGAAIDGISQNLAAAILGTTTWGDAWDNLKLQVAQTFLTMVIRYAATRAAMFAISKAFGLSEAAIGAVQATTTAAAWSPAATAASIATFGAAAAIGTGAYISGLATGQLATTAFSLAGAFRDGGIFRGEGTGTSDSNLIAVSDGEGIVKRAAVDHYGADVFNAFNNMQLDLGSRPAVSRGGGVSAPSAQSGGSSTSSMPNTTVIVVPDERAATRIARHSQAKDDIVRIVRENRGEIFGS